MVWLCGLKVMAVLTFLLIIKLTVHQRTHKDCITVPGRCYYYEYCGFETDSLQRLKDHLEDTKAEHMEYLTVKVAEMEQSSNKAKQLVGIMFSMLMFFSALSLLQIFTNKITGAMSLGKIIECNVDRFSSHYS